MSTSPQKAHGSPELLTVATPGNSQQWGFDTDDFDGTLSAKTQT
jgi:hypothetical protein